MDYELLLRDYSPEQPVGEVAQAVEAARAGLPRNLCAEVYARCFGCLDLTTLSPRDSVSSVTEFVRRAVEYPRCHAGLPNVASVCVYPLFVDTAGIELAGTDIAVTGVSAGFPSSLTFLEVKMLETSMAVEEGADEIDVVANIGQLLDGDYNQMANELEMLRGECGEDVVLKVILETNELRDLSLIRRASLLAMHAGADFIKTSTGKNGAGATPEAAATMCLAIRDYFARTGRRVGFKAAGGIRKAQDAALYYTIVEDILGKEWLCSQLFRLGASSLADDLVAACGL